MQAYGLRESFTLICIDVRGHSIINRHTVLKPSLYFSKVSVDVWSFPNVITECFRSEFGLDVSVLRWTPKSAVLERPKTYTLTTSGIIQRPSVLEKVL